VTSISGGTARRPGSVQEGQPSRHTFGRCSKDYLKGCFQGGERAWAKHSPSVASKRKKSSSEGLDGLKTPEKGSEAGPGKKMGGRLISR